MTTLLMISTRPNMIYKVSFDHFYRTMADTTEKDETSKSKLIPEKDVDQSVIPPSSILSDMEEGDEPEEEEYEEEEEEEEEEEYEEEEDEDEEEVEEKETLNDTNEKKDEKKSKEPKEGEELVENSNSKEKKPRLKEKNTKKSTNVANGDKPESSSKKKSSKRVESMGMVFMCSSKTKTDCFRYKVLGLPANKQDQVAKIYKGMRLFLFDVELRLMYGIFKAAGPGGYNIEPKAFKSEFPSQVRFLVLDDCLPIAEEQFKDLIKENYYTRNKFEGLLNADQVKKLCKLFAVTSKGKFRPKSESKRRTRPIENHRTRNEERRIRTREEDESRDRRKRKIRTRDRDDERRPRPRPRSRSRTRSPPRREKRRYSDYDRPPVLYERAAPVIRYLPPPPLSPARSYPYDRPPYDRVPYHDEIRARDWDRDPYYVHSREGGPPIVYGLPPEYQIVSREYNLPPPVVQPPPPEYRISDRYHDVGPPPLPDYRSSRTHYRY
ncbi:hypothetical protein LXL04_000584 [Taraxacum kok-saghyz]